MGTRHLIAVQIDGEYKVAQYGQWDGYIEGQGVDILEFLLGIGGDYEPFKQKIRECSFLTQEEIDTINDSIDSDDGTINGVPWTKVYPHLSRDMGAKVLPYILKNGGLKLNDRIGFAGDSLFCEWAYVIDFDKNTFEVYKGFNKTPLSEDERFYDIAIDSDANGYFQVRFVKSYDLCELPTVQQLIEDFTKKDEGDLNIVVRPDIVENI